MSSVVDKAIGVAAANIKAVTTGPHLEEITAEHMALLYDVVVELANKVEELRGTKAKLWVNYGKHLFECHTPTPGPDEPCLYCRQSIESEWHVDRDDGTIIPIARRH